MQKDKRCKRSIASSPDARTVAGATVDTAARIRAPTVRMRRIPESFHASRGGATTVASWPGSDARFPDLFGPVRLRQQHGWVELGRSVEPGW